MYISLQKKLTMLSVLDIRLRDLSSPVIVDFGTVDIAAALLDAETMAGRARRRRISELFMFVV